MTEMERSQERNPVRPDEVRGVQLGIGRGIEPPHAARKPKPLPNNKEASALRAIRPRRVPVATWGGIGRVGLISSNAQYDYSERAS